jgi:hypothetical protein
MFEWFFGRRLNIIPKQIWFVIVEWKTWNVLLETCEMRNVADFQEWFCKPEQMKDGTDVVTAWSAKSYDDAVEVAIKHIRRTEAASKKYQYWNE